MVSAFTGQGRFTMCRLRKGKSGGLALTMAVLLFFTCCALSHAAEGDDLAADIRKLVSQGPDSDSRELSGAIENRVRSNPSLAVKLLVPRLKDREASEQELAVTVWAVGLARDPETVDVLMELAALTRSELVMRNCYHALAAIGGEKPGRFLLAAYDKTPRQDIRADLIDLLCQMGYESALPRTEDILKKDFDEYYYESVFAFGKMGDKATPFLLGKIEDPDRNVRMHSIHVLGLWLMPLEAAQPLRDHYWKEPDPELRSLVLSSLERVSPDLGTLLAFFEEVVRKEKDPAPLKFARETIDGLERMKKALDVFAAAKRTAPGDFAAQYDGLYMSAGKTGDYGVLSATSSLDDEPKLKKLRERILQRNSDESFEDYQKVNRIILMNRLLKSGGQ